MFGLGSTEVIILMIIFIVAILAIGLKRLISPPKNNGGNGSININVNDSTSNFNKLSELKDLLDKGVLSQEEFEKEKKKILK